MAKTLKGTSGNDLLRSTISGAIVNALGGNDTVKNSGSKVTIDGGAGNDYIQNFGGSNVSIYGGAGSDSIYNTFTSSSDFSTGENVTINGGAGNDSIGNASNKKVVFEYDSGGGDDIILGYNSNDTLQINSSNYSTMVSGNDFIVFVGTGSVTLKNSANVAIKIRNSSGNLRTYNTNPVNVLAGTILDDEIINTNSNATVLGFAGNDNIINNADEVLTFGQEGNDIIISIGYNNTIAGFEGNDSILSYGDNGLIMGLDGNDTIIAQGKGITAVGGYEDDLISLDSANGGNEVSYGYGCGNDTVYGLKTNDTLDIYNGVVSKATISGNDVIVTIGDESLTLKDVKGQTLSAVDSDDISYIACINENDEITQIITNATKSLGTLAAAFKNTDASTRTKAIKGIGNELDNSIVGGYGDDTLNGGKGNDTLTGGGGDDIFIYSAGNDVISDYASGDKISLGAAITKAEVDGADVVFKFKNGSLTVKDAEGQSLSMIDSKGKSFSTVIGGGSSDSSDSDLMTVTNSSASVVTAGADIKTVDASKRTKAVKITGNALDNSIKGGAGVDSISGGDGADTLRGGKGNDSLLGGKGNDSIHGGSGNDRIYGNAGADVLFGGAGKDSLWGGAGNDTLWGSNGTDTFIYQAGGGNDSIMDYASGELLRLLTKDGKSNATFSKSAFDDDTLTLTVNGGGTVIFNNIDDETTFNINGTSYKVSGSKLAKS